MATVEDLELFFYILSGVTSLCLIVIFIFISILFYKVNRLKASDSNQLGRQTNMMAEFCYTNPTIVPGEQLSRRGFSMYNGSDTMNTDKFFSRNYDFSPNNETLSKF